MLILNSISPRGQPRIFFFWYHFGLYIHTHYALFNPCNILFSKCLKTGNSTLLCWQCFYANAFHLLWHAQQGRLGAAALRQENRVGWVGGFGRATALQHSACKYYLYWRKSQWGMWTGQTGSLPTCRNTNPDSNQKICRYIFIIHNRYKGQSFFFYFLTFASFK